MTCRQCGTVIADKALICYKCGTPTTEAKYAPVPIPRGARSGRVIVLVALLVAVLGGVYVGETAVASSARTLGWVVALAAVLVLGGRMVRRRRS